jgi:ribosomal protein L11 methyltransferase
MPGWTQVHVVVDAIRVPEVSRLFESAGALSVTISDAAEDPVYEPAPGELRAWRRNRVSGLFTADFAPAPLALAVAGRIGEQMSEWRVEPLEERDWERAWLDDFTAQRFGRRLWVCPTTLEPPVPGAVNLRLDPGLAFGTGNHPTTALCLEWLDATEPAVRLLDYGCGSGILAIAGLLLGSQSAWAVDIDPQALQATADNARLNGVAGRLACLPPERLAADARFDLLLANILAGPLCELAERFAALLEPGGRLVLSGILAHQADAVATAYRPHFDLPEYVEREGWCRLSGRRRRVEPAQ